jgi:hypothetical protein
MEPATSAKRWTDAHARRPTPVFGSSGKCSVSSATNCSPVGLSSAAFGVPATM